MKDFIEDFKLGIRTGGKDYSFMNDNNYGYDPTPYSVLKKLAESGRIGPHDTLVDYGCGKGRASIFLHDKTGCRSIGVDNNRKRIEEAEKNLDRYGRDSDIRFVCANAEFFNPKEGNCFYFFNPFSPDVFHKVLLNISQAGHTMGRDMRIFFYYPTSEYRYYFPEEKLLIPAGEIDCSTSKYWDGNYNRILMFYTA